MDKAFACGLLACSSTGLGYLLVHRQAWAHVERPGSLAWSREPARSWVRGSGATHTPFAGGSLAWSWWGGLGGWPGRSHRAPVLHGWRRPIGIIKGTRIQRSILHGCALSSRNRCGFIFLLGRRSLDGQQDRRPHRIHAPHRAASANGPESGVLASPSGVSTSRFGTEAIDRPVFWTRV